MSVLITVRIPKELRDEARKYGINVSKVLREALLREIAKRKLEKITKLQKDARKIISKIGKEKLITTVREIRNEY